MMPRNQARPFQRGALAALAGVLLCLASGPGEAQRREGFEEEVFVREVEIVFERPDLPALRATPFGPDDLLVVEDGLVRQVAKAAPVEDAGVRARPRRGGGAEAPAWSAVVWIDQTLADPETVFRATLSLARQAAALADLGTVEVVTASPEPEVALAATREAQLLGLALADLAGGYRVARDRSSPMTRPLAERGLSAAGLRRQLDRLVTHLAGRTEPGPRLLFLVMDGFDVEPLEAQAFELAVSARTADPGSERAEAILEAARLLAAYGWLTVALPLREAEVGLPAPQVSAADRLRTNAGDWGDLNNSVPPVLAPRPQKDSRLRWEEAIAVRVAPDLSPVRALTRMTGGTIVGHDELFPLALQGIRQRWHLYYRTEMTLDGELRPVEVRTKDGTVLHSRRWVRSSTPEGLAGARLRALLDGGRLPTTLPLRADWSGGELRLGVAPFSAPDPVRHGPVRVSLLFGREGEAPEIRHEILPGIDAPDRGWSRTVSAARRPDAVLVEDLARERWTAVRME